LPDVEVYTLPANVVGRWVFRCTDVSELRGREGRAANLKRLARGRDKNVQARKEDLVAGKKWSGDDSLPTIFLDVGER
jgi:hypothetical protein